MMLRHWLSLGCLALGDSPAPSRAMAQLARSFRAASWILTCCSIASLHAACSGHDEDGKEEGATQAVTADWIHPACAPDALQPPVNVTDGCNGPWTFGYVETSNDRNVCGEDTTKPCETYATCTSWDMNTPGDFGDVTIVTSSTEVEDGFSQGCTPLRCFSPSPATQCANAAAARQKQLLASLPPNLPGSKLTNFSVSGSPNIEQVDGPDPETGAITTWFSCTLTIHNLPTQTTRAKPVCGCVHYPAKTCERASGTTVTAPGLSRPTDPGTPTFPGDTRTFSSLPVCLTCDQIPIDSDANVQAKFDCLNSGLAAAAGPLHQSLAARIKLLFQLSGDRLTPDQRSQVQQLYDDDSTDGPACSTALAWDSACQTEAASLGLPSQLQLCQDLTSNDQTSRGIAVLELQHCLDLLATDAQIQTDTCRVQTRDVADTAAQAVLAKAYPALTGDLATQLPDVVTRIDAWWVAATMAAAGDHQWLLGHANTVLRQLWSSIEQAKLPLPQASGDLDAVAVLNQVNDTGFADDLGVLSALYAPGQSSVQPLLLTLTADALQPFADRLARLEALHDVGCRFAGCRSDDGAGNVTLRASAISELVHALAVLPDPDAFSAALAGASKLPGQEAALFNALTRLRDQHAYLDTAWAALGRSEPFAQLATIADPPAEAIALAGIVRAAAVAWSSYQASGEFAPWHRARLTTAALQQPALLAFVDGLRAQVASARTSYESQRLGLLNDLLNQSHEQAATQSATDRRTGLRDQDGDLVSRSLGMESREADERAGLAGFQTSFEALINSGVLDADATFQAQPQAPILTSAADAHFPGLPSQPDLARDAFHTVSLHPGDSLRVHVTGSWSPTCAVLHAQIPGPQGNFEPIQVANAQTGPDGYWLSRDSESFRSQSTNSSADFRKDVGLSVAACYTASLGPGSFQACAHADMDWSWTDGSTTSGGSNSRSSASFSTGIRLPNTPFPVAPAGSLVAVLTPTGHPDQVLDVRVVHRDDLIQAPALPPGSGDSVDVSFVVNDLGTCIPDTSQSLQIESVKSIPLGNTAKAFSPAMASALASLEAQAPAILAEGQLTTEEAANLRLSGWNLVAQSLQPQGIDVAGLPYELHQLFDTYLEREIASIARRSEMHAIARQRVQIQLAETALEHELAFDDTQNRLLMLAPRWRMRDLSGAQLAQAVDALSSALTADIAETFELRDPDAFKQFSGSDAQQPDAQPPAALIDLGVTRPTTNTAAGQEHYEDAVAALESFASAASSALSQATFDPASTLRRTLVLAIPRTVATCNGGPCDYKDSWTSVSAAAAQAFWSAATTAPFAANLTIAPSDLYSALGTGRLDCGDTAPVIRRMALYLDTPKSSIDLRTMFLDVSGVAAAAGEPVLFPLVDKVLSIDADDPAGVALSLPAINGDVLQVLDRFGPSTAELGTGAGLSPFTTFHIDMTPFQAGTPKNALAAATAVLLVFEVERRVSTSDVQVPGVCTPLTP